MENQIESDKIQDEINAVSTPLEPAPNLDDLVFKTMPKADGGISKLFHPPVAPKPVYMPNQSLPTPPEATPKPVHLSVPVPPSHGPLTAINPVTPVAAPTMSEDDFHSLNAPRRGAAVRNILITLIVLIIIGAGAYFAYAKGLVKNPFAKKPAKQDQNSSPVTVAVPTQIPDSWRLQYFNNAVCPDQSMCGDAADPDKDGLSNLQEYQKGTDPNNADSDGDQISDGDEVNIFGYDPSNKHTSGNLKYDDGLDAKYEFNSTKNAVFTADELQQISANVKQYGFHEPTIGFLGQDLITDYTNAVNIHASSASAAAVQQPGALDRDTQRYNTIDKIAFALLKYQETNNTYPDVQSYDQMIQLIKPLIASQAINTADPTNTAPYLYSYQSVNKGADFKLGYYSETQNQAIILNAAAAQKAYAQNQSVQRDTQRKTDLEQIAGALQLYSNDHASQSNPSQQVFPAVPTWKSDLEAKYISKVPVDPQTKQDYLYTVSADQSSFALQTTLENPPTGKRGYVCTSDTACDFY